MRLVLMSFGLMVMMSGCVVVTVADTAASAAATAVKTTVYIAGAAIDVAIPDSDDEEKDVKKE